MAEHVGHFEGAGHLPKNRDGAPADPRGLPRQRRGTTPQMHGRYPDYDVLAEADHWDEETRKVVFARLEAPGPLRFFSAEEAAALAAFCDCLLAQDDEPRIPVLAAVDAKLADGKLDGYQYAELPDDRDTWRLVARGLDEQARSYGWSSYAEAPAETQRRICDDFHKGELSGGVWDDVPAARAYSVVTRAALAAFYAHPWAWNEIGYGGPAYPRGFMRLGVGQSDAWEAVEAFALDPVSDVNERGLE